MYMIPVNQPHLIERDDVRRKASVHTQYAYIYA